MISAEDWQDYQQFVQSINKLFKDNVNPKIYLTKESYDILKDHVASNKFIEFLPSEFKENKYD